MAVSRVDNSDPSLPSFNEETEGWWTPEYLLQSLLIWVKPGQNLNWLEIEGFNMPVHYGSIYYLVMENLHANLSWTNTYDITEWDILRCWHSLKTEERRGILQHRSSHPRIVFYWDQRPLHAGWKNIGLVWTFDRKDVPF